MIAGSTMGHGYTHNDGRRLCLWQRCMQRLLLKGNGGVACSGCLRWCHYQVRRCCDVSWSLSVLGGSQKERGSLTGGLRWKQLAIGGAEYGGSSVSGSPITSGNCDLRFDVCCARCNVHRDVAQRRRVRLGGRSAMR